MKITGISAETFRSIVDTVNKDYAGNLVIENINEFSGNRFSAKLGTKDSRAFGSRTSASGRRGRYACWHAFRDVIAAVFEANEDARVVTGMANYKGKDVFEDLFPGTADRNVGSMIQPAYMDDLCSC